MIYGELSLIARYFDRIRSSRLDVKLGISDDCALLNIPEKRTLVINTDMLMVDNHFLPDIDPADLAYKTLAVNLSDLTAIEADPAWLTLALALPGVDEAWLESFSDSLFSLLNYCDMQLVSDGTAHGPLSMTLGIHGFVPMGRALTRSRAKPSDWIYVAGTPGDSTAGLAILRNHLQVTDAEDADHLIEHHLRPSPRILQGQILRGLTNSTIDFSDGLTSDLGHIVKASNCGARINLALLPFSDALSRHVEPEQALHWALSGGEDYELCFTVPELNRGALDVALGHLGVPFTCIGRMTASIGGLCFIRDGKPITLDWEGCDHFTTPQGCRKKSPKDE